MKASKYNFFFPYEPDDNKIIAYNSFSNALALMEKDKYSIFKAFVDEGKEIEDENFVSQLQSGHFLIEDDFNELYYLKHRMLKDRYKTDYLNLTIATTADCNFRCIYCYEKDVIKPEYMTVEVEEKIIELVENRANSISNLSICWYGGEPLMNMGSIERLSRKFIEICEKHNISYSASAITNGSLLTRENVILLNELKVTYLQVTLDGSKITHDRRRPFVNGTGTFDSIINNMIENKDILPQINLRINVDKANIELSKEVHDILKDNDLLGIAYPHYGKVTDLNDSYSASLCYESREYSEKAFEFYSKTVNESNFMNRYPTRSSNVCSADSIGSYIIAADGRLYKCLENIGKVELCIGSLSEESKNKANVNHYFEYMLFDPTSDKMCSQCNILPLCMGGCPNGRLSKEDDNCSVYKYVLADYLDIISKKMAK